MLWRIFKPYPCTHFSRLEEEERACALEWNIQSSVRSDVFYRCLDNENVVWHCRGNNRAVGACIACRKGVICKFHVMMKTKKVHAYALWSILRLNWTAREEQRICLLRRRCLREKIQNGIFG